MVKKGIFRRARQASASRAQRRKDERGASTVEFALVAPLFFLVVFGGIEIGLMFRSYLALENVSRSAARIASIERDSLTSDNAVLDRIDNLVDPLQGDVQRVVIFRADNLDSEVPPLCLTQSSDILDCNSYQITDGDLTTANAGTLGWIGTDRDALDNVGVHIEFEYTYATGFLDTLTFSTTTVEVIELDF